MKWSEILKIAKAHGFVFERHGGKHDIYRNPQTGQEIQIERHGSHEVGTGLANKLIKQIKGK